MFNFELISRFFVCLLTKYALYHLFLIKKALFLAEKMLRPP